MAGEIYITYKSINSLQHSRVINKKIQTLKNIADATLIRLQLRNVSTLT